MKNKLYFVVTDRGTITSSTFIICSPTRAIAHNDIIIRDVAVQQFNILIAINFSNLSVHL